MSTEAPAARALLTQASERYPGRHDGSDGIRGDARHATAGSLSWHLGRRPRLGTETAPGPTSPDGRVYVRDDQDGIHYAVDLSHSPAVGLDVHAFVRKLVARRDPRVAEVISCGEIWTKARAGEGWRSYYGESPHTAHAHITIDPRYADDVSPWWEDDMTPEQAAQLNDAFLTIRNVGKELREARNEIAGLKAEVIDLRSRASWSFTLEQIATAVADTLAERAKE